MHLFLASADAEPELRAELAEVFPGVSVCEVSPLLFGIDAAPASQSDPWPQLVFSRQLLPNARVVRAESIRAWAAMIADAVMGVVPEDQPWTLHIEPHYGAQARHHIGARAWHSASRQPTAGTQRAETASSAPAAEAGRHRCKLIRDSLIEVLQKRRRHLLRRLRCEEGAFSAGESLVQVLLTAPEAGFISVATAPLPFEQRHVLSPFRKGEVPIASDKEAPSRAFAKLVEAEMRLGRMIQAGESCIDLGASPGSWTYTAVCRGAQVIAVDRSPLRADLMQSALVHFHQGDAFTFAPPKSVDWLICDVIATPEQSAGLLLEWLKHGWCRRFIVTIKLKDSSGGAVLADLKRRLPPLTSDLFLLRLCANKKEACAFGVAAPRKPV
ncbi:MAG: hypothetical protein RLY20_3058 [Verrucomicrobiota bacterium]|jgi:23S rRNA (cytidine2498-2'-O)-methyltransferase